MTLKLFNGYGNVSAYVGYRNAKAVLQESRDYTGCDLGGAPGAFACSGSLTTPLGTFTDPTFSQFFLTLDET